MACSATAQGLLPESIDLDSEIKRTNGLTGALVTAIDDLVDEHYRDENEELPDDCQEMWEVSAAFTAWAGKVQEYKVVA